MIGIILFIIWLIISIMSYLKNRDLFSPTKFYMLNIGVYFAKIFYSEYSLEVQLNYFCFLLIGFFLLILEPKRKKNLTSISFEKSKINFKFWNRQLWRISIIPILAQIYLIQHMGGFTRYFNKIGLRVLEWQGMGIVLEIIKLFSIINIIYFVFVLIDSRSTKRDWFKYFFHLFILLIIGLLSGSRGALLGNFVLMIVIYNYMRNRLRIKLVSTFILVLLTVASIIGVARNGYKLGEDGFVTGLSLASGKIMNLQHFSYGLKPLELIYEKEVSELQGGLTFLTPFTNVVPRKMWPAKPDTGGIVFTKIYTNDAWGGYSNLAPGIIGEGVINFGLIIGIPVGLFLLLILMVLNLRIYASTMRNISNPDIDIKKIFDLIFYCFIVTTIPGLVQSEWTNTILSLVYRYFKLMLVYYFIREYIKMLKLLRR